MARLLREVPAEVARQATINKTINASQLEAAAEGPQIKTRPRDLQLLASNVPVPELLPFEYAYVDLYADGRGRFYISINETFHRRSWKRTMTPA